MVSTIDVLISMNFSHNPCILILILILIPRVMKYFPATRFSIHAAAFNIFDPADDSEVRLAAVFAPLYSYILTGGGSLRLK